MSEHIHNWQVMSGSGDKLICRKDNCDTVSTINTLITNTAAETATATKIKIYSKQLYARELKKDAHDAAYAWVLANSPRGTMVDNKSRQEVLL